MAFDAIHLIPTGVGASIGGFAGDGAPVTALLAGTVDSLLTHPNAVNAATLFALPANAHYVEGWALERWMAGEIALRPRVGNRVGLLLDAAIEQMPVETLTGILNAAHAVQAVFGVECVGYLVTDEPVGARLGRDGRGRSSTGSLSNPSTLLAGARELLARGAEAIAVMVYLGDGTAEEELAYQTGQGVDPIGGLEAIISHLLVSELRVPAAHAPLYPFSATGPGLVDPRAAAEYIGQNYLPCILQGLARHPRLIAPAAHSPGDLNPRDLGAVVVPATCVGGPIVLQALENRIPVITVADNETALDVTIDALGVSGQIFTAKNYLEACGLLTALRLGLAPGSVQRPLAPIRNWSLASCTERACAEE